MKSLRNYNKPDFTFAFWRDFPQIVEGIRKEPHNYN